MKTLGSEGAPQLLASESNRLGYLDVLRGLAALAVCVQHIFGYILHSYDPSHALYPYVKYILSESIDWGRFGVVLFFFISGFIIPNSLKPGSTLKKFFVNRFFRLYPAYWFALFLIFIAGPYVESVEPYSYHQLLANVTMAPKIFGSNEMSGVFWTLFIEILFYGCCAILFLLNWLDKPIVIGLAALGLNLTTPISILANKFFQIGVPIQFVLFHLSFLFAGNLLRLAFVRKHRLAAYLSIVFFLLNLMSVPIVTGLLFSVPEAIEKGFVMFRSQSVVYAYGFASILFVCAIFYKKLNNKFMAKLGELSYSLYLLHMLSFAFVLKFVRPETLSSLLVYLILCGVITYYFSKFSFNYIERPAIELGRRIVKWRGFV